MKASRQRIQLDQPGFYKIQVQGLISEHYLAYLGEMEVTVEGEDGGAITTLFGEILDQAELQGLLQKLYSLGLVLITVERKENF
jgi:hypothetical protein